jgi:hypothetical protein
MLQNESLYRDAYFDYLVKAKEKNGKIKTILYKQEPKDLYRFYECLGVRHKDKIVDTTNVNNLIKIGHKLIVTGTGGIGKTIMMKHCFLNAISTTSLIPVLIELRGVNDCDPSSIDIKKYMYECLRTFGFSLDEETFNFSLEMGRYLIIFDGYDEVKKNLAQKIEAEILKLSDQYTGNYYIVSSRPMDNSFVAWSSFVEVQAVEMNKTQALSMIDKLEYDETIKRKFYDELVSGLFDRYKSFASNPLLLTIMLLTFNEGGSIPEKLNEFYEQAFVALFNSHDASKGAYRRDKSSKLGYPDFKIVFSHVCFKSFYESCYEFTEDKILEYINKAKNRCTPNSHFTPDEFLSDLTNSVCMMIHEGLNYRFSHRSFQEYLAAYYTMQLDDDTQRQVIKGWIKVEKFGTTSYLNILKDLQPDRFIQNVILPGLTEILKKANGLDDLARIQLITDAISFDINRDKYLQKKGHSPSIRIINGYYFEIMRHTGMFGQSRGSNEVENNDLWNEVRKIFTTEEMKRPIPIGLMKEHVELKRLLIVELSWICNWFESAARLFEKIKTSRKKNTSLHAILKDL